MAKKDPEEKSAAEEPSPEEAATPNEDQASRQRAKDEGRSLRRAQKAAELGESELDPEVVASAEELRHDPLAEPQAFPCRNEEGIGRGCKFVSRQCLRCGAREPKAMRAMKAEGELLDTLIAKEQARLELLAERRQRRGPAITMLDMGGNG